MSSSGLRFQKGDILVILGVLVLAVAVLLCFLPTAEPVGAVEIYHQGRLIKTLSLEKDQEFQVQGDYSCTITLRNGQVAITQSDCPGGDCVACGWMDSPGRSIVCLPNAVELRLVGLDSDVDFVVG